MDVTPRRQDFVYEGKWQRFSKFDPNFLIIYTLNE